MRPDDLATLLPPVPQPRALPRRAAHRDRLLAAIAAEPGTVRSARRGWSSARRWLIPLAAAAAVIAVVIAAVALPLLARGPGRPAHPGQHGNQQPPSPNRGSLPKFRRWDVPSGGVMRVFVRSDAGPVTVAAQLASAARGRAETVRVSATPSYHGTPPIVQTVVSRGTLLISARCLAASGAHCRVSLVLTVPRNVPVRISSQLGDVILDNLAGPIAATSNAGDIWGVGLRSQHVSVADDLGAINLSFVTPPLMLTATSREGDVTLMLPGFTAYWVSARSQLGSTSTSVPLSNARTHVVYATSQLGDVTITG